MHFGFPAQSAGYGKVVLQQNLTTDGPDFENSDCIQLFLKIAKDYSHHVSPTCSICCERNRPILILYQCKILEPDYGHLWASMGPKHLCYVFIHTCKKSGGKGVLIFADV